MSETSWKLRGSVVFLCGWLILSGAETWAKIDCNPPVHDQEVLLQDSIAKNHRRLEEIKTIPVSKEINTKAGGEITISRRGLAPEYKVFTSTKDMVFRHYTTREAAAEIRVSRILNAGPRPSAITLNSSLEVNPDIYGVFFTDTLPNRRAPADLVPVDFTLPDGYQIIQTFQDEYVIVGPRPMQSWLLAEVNKNPAAHPTLTAELKLQADGKYGLKEEPLRVLITPVE